MAWDELVPPDKSQAAAEARPDVRVGMVSMRGAAPRMVVLIRGRLLDRLAGDVRRFRIDVGTADHRHLLRIRQANDGPFEGSAFRRARGKVAVDATYRFTLPVQDRFPVCALKAQSVEGKHDVVGKCLMITLPSWAWNDQRKKEVEREALGGGASVDRASRRMSQPG